MQVGFFIFWGKQLQFCKKEKYFGLCRFILGYSGWGMLGCLA